MSAHIERRAGQTQSGIPFHKEKLLPVRKPPVGSACENLLPVYGLGVFAEGAWATNDLTTHGKENEGDVDWAHADVTRALALLLNETPAPPRAGGG
jgi:hypothetical protein